MESHTKRRAWLSLALGTVLGLVSCTGASSGAGGVSSGGLRIIACSLGCSASNSTGGQISCGITAVFVNQAIRITFNRPIDLASVTNNSFQMVQKDLGVTPPGSFSRDPVDHRVLVYRPLLTFDSTGAPVIGLTADEEYLLTIPGTQSGDLGPYIRDEGGDPNTARLQCTLVASRGVFDATPGAPAHKMTVTTVNTNVVPPVFTPNVDARGATNVSRNTDILIVFDDVMNPATLANPVTGESQTVRVLIDPDGNTLDTSDQVEVDGTFTITADQAALVTTVLFRSTSGFPSSGAAGTRRIVVDLSPTIADLGGNLLVSPGPSVFTIETISFPTVVVDELFDDSSFEDSVHSSSPWGAGVLAPISGGGSGRLGDLVVPIGSTVILNTDSEDFSAAEFDNPEVFNPQNVVDADDLIDMTTMRLTVKDGIFEFARLIIEAGAVLRLEGSKPGRIFVRGEAIVQGRIDVSGGSGLIHDPLDFLGGTAGMPGPGGGQGGTGGERPDGELFAAILDPTGLRTLDNPNDPGPIGAAVTNSANYTRVNGQPGQGIGFPDTMLAAVAFGNGGLAWPQPGILPFPWDLLHFPADVTDALTSFPFEPFAQCQITSPGAVGSGGAYALSGLTGVTRFIPAFVDPPLAPEALGGDHLDLGLDPAARSLDPELGYLRGGAGGGGGGAHLQSTIVNGLLLTDCTIGSPTGSTLAISALFNWSSAGGGSAGGAINIEVGRRLVLTGSIDASGGDGGGATGVNLAQPGGGGTGGAILLTGPQITVQSTTDRLLVDGGVGGQNFLGSNGGKGGPGLIRVASDAPGPTLAAEKIKISPTEAEIQAVYGSGVTVASILTADVWSRPTTGPGTLSGAQSCWKSERDLFDPANPSELLTNFFQLVFEADGAELGWDMTLNITGFGPQSYRGPNTLPIGGMTLEEYFLSELGVSPVLVRFQGARAATALITPCKVPLAGLNSPIQVGSLTGWVNHPSGLVGFFPNASLTANMFRFMVIWDTSITTPFPIESIEDLFIRLTPD